jgi:hypothetical protein
MPRGSELNEVDFVTIWQTSKSRAEVVARAGMDFNTLRVRANYYRRQGVDLKYYDNNNYKDYSALAELAEKLKK